MVDEIEFPFNTGTDTVSGAFIVPVSANTGDKFRLQIKQVSGDDIIIESMSLVIQ